MNADFYPRTFKFALGEPVWQMNSDGDFDSVIIADRKIINSEPYYTTDMYDKWTNESFLV